MKRRGFTLIELMVVIAIIIILAAIAIPNYLNMTARAKKSRVASDFAALSTALESYNTDWGTYPKTAGSITVSAATGIFAQIAGVAPSTDTASGPNVVGASTLTGDTGSIAYVTPSILTSMTNPYNKTDYYTYTPGTAVSGVVPSWILSAKGNTGDTTKPYWVRQSSTTDLVAWTTAATP